MIRVAGALAIAGGLWMTAAAAEIRSERLNFSDLNGWAEDDHEAALATFRETCTDLRRGDWPAICAAAEHATDARGFFEMLFRPVLVTDGTPALFTGYYEPELLGSRTPSARFRYPLYSRPPEMPRTGKWLTRAQIERQGVLEGRGLEIAYVENPVEAFFLQVQGSGRIRLPDGTALRLGFGGKNGHDYRSVGRELVRRGLFKAHQVSAATIRKWVKANPVEGAELLRVNPSFVFFRELRDVPWEKGPLGAMNRSVTAGRTVAVDPRYVPLGAPVWVEKDGADPMRRLMVAQDTGSAIKGPQRADIFYGSGDAAGAEAGRIKDPGRMVVLLPLEEAFAAGVGG